MRGDKMNQILDYNPNKSTKGSSGSDKIVRFFAIVLIIFALCLVASGIYKMYSRSTETNENVATVQDAEINTIQTDSTLQISVVHTVAIEKLVYSWNNSSETTVKGTGDTTLEKEIPLPAGTNLFHAKVIDVDGNETTYEKQFTAVNGADILNPVITLKVTDDRKLKITVTDETELDFITYRWNYDDEVVIEATGDKKTIETEIDILKGSNDITVVAVDSSSNTTTETKNYTGLTNPEITLTLSADKTTVKVEVKHENGIKGITGSLNGQDFNVDGIEEGTTSLNFDLALSEGTNQVKVVATSVDATSKTAEQEFTYGIEETEETTNNTASDVQDTTKPQVSITQETENNKKAYFELKYENGLKSAVLELNGQSYDVNLPENATDVNFELDLADGENSIMITVVGEDGATQVVNKKFTVQ
jgi:hypothetical protein